MTCASKQMRAPGASLRSQSKTARSSSYTPNFGEAGSVGWAPLGQGYLVAASSAARVRFRPTLVTSPVAGSVTKRLGSIRVSRRSDWALPSKPPQSSANSFSACSPLCPKGGWPRSWERQAASTRSGSQPRAAPSSRPTWAHSREWVRRVRGLASQTGLASPGVTTWVLPARRRSAAECSTRARSRWKAVRPGRLSGSAAQRSTAAGSYPAGGAWFSYGERAAGVSGGEPSMDRQWSRARPKGGAGGGWAGDGARRGGRGPGGDHGPRGRRGRGGGGAGGPGRAASAGRAQEVPERWNGEARPGRADAGPGEPHTGRAPPGQRPARAGRAAVHQNAEPTGRGPCGAVGRAGR